MRGEFTKGHNRLKSSLSSIAMDEEKQAPEEVTWKPSIHELAIMITLSITSLMMALDATIVVTTIEIIVSELNGTATEGFWIGTAYLLTCAVTMPFTASLSDIFGRPICLFASLAIFFAGTVICCVSNDLATLIAGRAVQGVGGGGLIILGLVIFTDIVPLRFRSKYYGILQGAWAVGTCTGPLFGGLFVEHTSWRWIFYMMFPFIAIAAVTLPFVLTIKPKTESLVVKLARVDWFGGFLFIASSTSFLIAVSWGGTQEPWGSYRTMVPLTLGALGMAATCVWEGYFAAEPFMKRGLFCSLSSVAAYTSAVAQGYLLYSLLYYGPFYFFAVKGYGPVRTGASILPATVSLVPVSIIVGNLITRFGTYRWAIWSGWAVASLGHGLMILFQNSTPTPAWAAIIVIIGVGHGLILNSTNFAIQAMAPDGHEAAAAAMYAFLRTFGMALGVGIGGSVFQNVAMVRLAANDLPANIARLAEVYIPRVWADPTTEQAQKIIDAFTYGLHGVYGSFVAIAGIAGLLSLFIKHYKLDKELSTEHTLAENSVTRKLDGLAVRTSSKAGSSKSARASVEVTRIPSSNVSTEHLPITIVTAPEVMKRKPLTPIVSAVEPVSPLWPSPL